MDHGFEFFAGIAGAFIGGLLMRLGWVRAKGPKGLPSLTGGDDSGGNGHGNGNGNGNGGAKNGSVGREEFNDVLLELGTLKLELGKVQGKLGGMRHCEHCYRREA